SGRRWSIVGMAMACSTRSGTLVGPGICRKCRPVCGEAVFFIGAAQALRAGPLLPRASIKAVELGGVVVRQLLSHFDRESGHLPFDCCPRIGPHAVGMRVIGSPQRMGVAEEGDQ